MNEPASPRRFWTELAARLVAEAVHYFQILLMTALVTAVLLPGDRGWAAAFLSAGAWCAPLPVGIGYAVNVRAENHNAFGCRLRSYGVAAAAMAALFAVFPPGWA